jgi:hypothetical protein
MRGQGLAAIVCALAVAVSSACGGDDGSSGSTTPGNRTAVVSPTPAAAEPTPASGIVIDEPAEGSVRVPIEMSGQANVFEGALTIDAVGSDGTTVLCSRHVQVEAGSGTPAVWKGTLAFVPTASGEVPVTLRAYSLSARDGSMENLVTRSVTLADFTPPLFMSAPACGAEASGSLTVSGLSTFFEMPFFVDVRDASGQAIVKQRVFAKRETTLVRGVDMAPWEATLDLSGVAPGFYDIVAYTRSASDGSPENEFPVQISVR